LFDRYSSRTLVERQGQRVVTDAILLDPAHGALPERMGRFDAFATLLAIGPAAVPICGAILAMPQNSPPGGEGRQEWFCSASPLGEDGAILRVAATTTERVAQAIREALAAALCVLLG